MSRSRLARCRRLPGALVLAAATACAGDAPPPEPAALPPPVDTARTDTATADDARAAEIQVFFTRNEQPVPVTRRVPSADAPLRAAMTALLAGPTEDERTRGLSSWFSDETAGMLLGVNLTDDGHAVIDFADFSETLANASSSAGSAQLLGELNATVFQFAEVRSVEYRFAGDCARFFEWLQRSCERIERPE